MLTFDEIKKHFDRLVENGENAKSSATNYTNTIFKTLNDLDGFESIATCCNTKLVHHIHSTYDHPGTRSSAFLAWLRAINTYDPLRAAVSPATLKSLTEGFETAKLQAKERSIQRQLTEKVERLDDIIAKIEGAYEPLSDEVLLVRMYQEVAMRRDFDDILLIVGEPDASVQRYIDIASGELVIKNYNKTAKRYDALRHTLSPEMLAKVREVSAKRKYLLVLRSDTLFRKMSSVVPGIGSQMLRKSKVSTATEGDKLLDPEIRHELHSKMKHSATTQLSYRRELIQNDL